MPPACLLSAGITGSHHVAFEQSFKNVSQGAGEMVQWFVLAGYVPSARMVVHIPLLLLPLLLLP